MVKGSAEKAEPFILYVKHLVVFMKRVLSNKGKRDKTTGVI